ncbi:MAG: sulfatase-like hydrolase/transferase [bacterium]
MTRNRWIAVAMVVAAIGVGVWMAPRWAIYVPGMLSDWRNPIGPNQPVPWSAGPAAPAQDPRPPNIVLILADDLGWNDISFYGGGVAGGSVPTPHIDAIAEGGAHFLNGYAAHGTCAPSRAALMSGRYGTRFGFEFTPTPDGMPTIVGMLHNANAANIHPIHRVADAGDDELAFEEKGMPADEVTLAELLAAQGYHTMHVGKWHLGHNSGSGPEDQGFAESLNMASGMYLPEDHPEAVNARVPFDPIDQFLWASLRHAVNWNGGPRFEPDGYLTDYFTEQAVTAIEKNRHRPFFLYLAHWAPHTPLQALRADYDALAHIEDHRLRVYAAMIRSLDRGVGRVTDTLRRLGLEDNTLVIFTSDNGGAGYIGLPDVNQPYRGWKITFFEGGIRVPYFLKWPARIAPGSVLEAPVHHFDLYATAAAAAGAGLPDDRVMDGVNLLPYVSGDVAAPQRPLFWRSGHYQVVLAGGWKLQRSDRPERVWLHHVAEDPTEQRDLAAEFPEKVAELAALLDAHNADQAAPLWASRAEFPVLIDKPLGVEQLPTDEYVYVPN